MGIEENLLNRRIATITVGLAALVVSGAISYIWYGRKAKKNITFIESENINSIFPSTCDFEETPFTSDVKEISPSACDVIKKSSEVCLPFFT